MGVTMSVHDPHKFTLENDAVFQAFMDLFAPADWRDWDDSRKRHAAKIWNFAKWYGASDTDSVRPIIGRIPPGKTINDMIDVWEQGRKTHGRHGGPGSGTDVLDARGRVPGGDGGPRTDDPFHSPKEKETPDEEATRREAPDAEGNEEVKETADGTGRVFDRPVVTDGAVRTERPPRRLHNPPVRRKEDRKD